MTRRSYEGPALDSTYQHITERPELDDADDVVYATEPEPAGKETAENVPMPDGGTKGSDGSGQATLDDRRWSE